MLHLSGVQHALQPARLLRQLEQSLPLVLGKQGLLERRTAGVLLLALRLPLGNLLLFTGERTLVVLEVVILGVVGLDAVQEQVAVLLQEGVDAQGEVVEVGGQKSGRRQRSSLQSGERWREVQRLLGRRRRQLVKEGGEDVRVVDGHGEFDENLLVSEVRLLETGKAKTVSVSSPVETDKKRNRGHTSRR